MKQELIELIEAYAAAKAVNNPRLVQISAGDISMFLQSVEIISTKQQEETVSMQQEEKEVAKGEE